MYAAPLSCKPPIPQLSPVMPMGRDAQLHLARRPDMFRAEPCTARLRPFFPISLPHWNVTGVVWIRCTKNKNVGGMPLTCKSALYPECLSGGFLPDAAMRRHRPNRCDARCFGGSDRKRFCQVFWRGRFLHSLYSSRSSQLRDEIHAASLQ